MLSCLNYKENSLCLICPGRVFLFFFFLSLTLVHVGGSDHKSSEESKAHVLLHPLPELSGTEDVFPRCAGEKTLAITSTSTLL